ncbi:MAG: hypothetical protein SPE49_08325 [Campylobacter sp.]|uniref:hypothetical protein n=1 Tax=Campylobacter sp. TaxID=205 RepID=UPI002A81205B|nr:hypothetical protein [Campylobacter sp.]MDY5115953.1 hypothetical protein [Campylobacter sp.]MDY5384420.1 hypothetical protein [Campylobacter sp.]
MINGFEYRDSLPKCPERSDRWLSPSNDECERDDECEEYGEDGDEEEPSEDGDEDEPSDDDSDQEPSEDGDDDSHQEPSDDELAYQEFLDAFGKK